MSDPVDARVLRWMVRETANESASPVDWDAAEEKLLARLDAPPSVLGKALLDASSIDGTNDEEDETLGVPIIASEGAAARVRGVDEPGTDIRLSSPTLAHAGSKTVEALYSPGGTHALFLQGDVGDDESAAIDSVHSSSMLHDPPRIEKPQRARARRARWATVASLVAVAACAVFFTGTGRFFGRGSNEDSRTPDASIQAEHWVDAADVPLAPGLDGVRDLSALHAGDVVEATDGALSFGTKDRLTWTLAPGTRVLVRAGIEPSSTRHVLVLENGSIHADVAPLDMPAAGKDGAADSNWVATADSVGLFVVEAGDTQVATVGAGAGVDAYQRTAFSVTRSSIGIVVDVEEGSTRVSARSDLHPSEARFLSAPHRAAVSLDGAKDFRLIDAVRTAMLLGPSVTVPSDRFARSPDATRSVPRVDDEPRATDRGDAVDPTRKTPAPTTGAMSDRTGPVGARAPSEEPALTEAAIVASLNACFASTEAKRRSEDKDGSVSASIRSTLTLGIDDQSTLRNAAFNPPLRPDLQSCVVGLLHKKVEGGPRTITVPIDIAH